MWGIALLTLCIGHLQSAKAQSTWHGLRFGMSRSEASSSMEANGLPLKASDTSILYTITDFDYHSSRGQSIPFGVSLTFAEDRLSEVTLTMDFAAMSKFVPSPNTAGVIALDGPLMEGELLLKYGKATKESSSECDDPMTAYLNQESSVCEATWALPDQNVSLLWSFSSKAAPNEIQIYYRPTPHDL